jgi:hypothetical protein
LLPAILDRLPPDEDTVGFAYLGIRQGTDGGPEPPADPLGPQHDSLTELWKFAIALGRVQAVDRPIGNPARLAADPSGQKFPPVEANETIHPSVRRRLGQQVEVRSEHASQTITYQPANLPVA